MLTASNALIKVVPGLMIWTIICFFITLFVLKRYAFGPIQKIIEERRVRIRQSMEETRRQIEAETQRALEQIRSEVAELTLIATERVTGKVLSGDDQRRLIDEAISGLAFSVLEKVESR